MVKSRIVNVMYDTVKVKMKKYILLWCEYTVYLGFNYFVNKWQQFNTKKCFITHLLFQPNVYEIFIYSIMHTQSLEDTTNFIMLRYILGKYKNIKRFLGT